MSCCSTLSSMAAGHVTNGYILDTCVSTQKITARRNTFWRSHHSRRRRRNLALETGDTRTPKPHHFPALQKHKRYYLHHRTHSPSPVPTRKSSFPEMVACPSALTRNLHVHVGFYHQARATMKKAIPPRMHSHKILVYCSLDGTHTIGRL
jgi:hypothetical protein